MKKKLYKTWKWKKKRQEWLRMAKYFGDENLWDDVILLSRFAH